MRADRLLSILLLLQVHRQMTARELSERLEVSERTIYRDVDALSAAGVPVVAERGSGGGLSLMEGFRTNLTGLTSAEIQTVFLAQPVKLLSDLGLHHVSEAAMTKMLASLPAISRQNAELVRQRIHIDASGWQAREDDVTCLSTLQDAIWQERKLWFLYERGDGHVERVTDPLGLVAKGSVWYLVARTEGEIRSYRVSRIREVRISDEPFERPEDFKLAEHWQQSTTDFIAGVPRYPAIIRAHPDILPHVPHVGRFTRIERTEGPDEDGWYTVHIRFQLEWEARHYVLGFADQIEVIEPEELRRSVAECYTNSATTRSVLDTTGE